MKKGDGREEDTGLSDWRENRRREKMESVKVRYVLKIHVQSEELRQSYLSPLVETFAHYREGNS